MAANAQTFRANLGRAQAPSRPRPDQGFAFDDNNHLEVAIHSPTGPFGSVHVESNTPIFQGDGVYGANAEILATYNTLSGTVTNPNSKFLLSSGTTIYAQSVLQSRKRLRYRGGQGSVGLFTAAFGASPANSYALVGFGHSEDGLYLGRVNGTMGALYSSFGVREVRTLTVTTGSSTAESVTITLNGTANSVTVTNSGNIQTTVWELATGTYSGWDAFPSGATVVFVRRSAGPASGTYSYTATTMVGSFAQTKAGVISSDEFVAYESWSNYSYLSALGLDFSTLLVYRMGMQFLGGGPFGFEVEVNPANGSNPTFVETHLFNKINTLTKPTFGNPAFPFTALAYSAGSTTNFEVSCGSFGGFIEGEKMLHGPAVAYDSFSTAVGSAAYRSIFTVLNPRYYAGRTNQAVINLIDMAAAVKHTQPVTIYAIRNGSLAGAPNFAQKDSSSCGLWDTAATTVSGGTIIGAWPLAETGSLQADLIRAQRDRTIQPGEWVTFAAKSVTGTPSYVAVALNTIDDQ